jgi:hypothetical protein
MNDKELKEEYERIQAIRENNAKQRVPPVCTRGWSDEDYDRWLEWRKPLPPFDEWEKSVSD